MTSNLKEDFILEMLFENRSSPLHVIDDEQEE